MQYIYRKLIFSRNHLSVELGSLSPDSALEQCHRSVSSAPQSQHCLQSLLKGQGMQNVIISYKILQHWHSVKVIHGLNIRGNSFPVTSRYQVSPFLPFLLLEEVCCWALQCASRSRQNIKQTPLMSIILGGGEKGLKSSVEKQVFGAAPQRSSSQL